MFPNTLWVLWAASFCTCLPIICYLSSTCLRDTVGALAALVSVVFLGALGRDFALLPLVSHLYPNRLVSHWNTCLSLVPLVPSCVCLLARCRRLASQCSSICLVLVVRCRCLGPHDSPNSSIEKESLCVPFVSHLCSICLPFLCCGCIGTGEFPLFSLVSHCTCLPLLFLSAAKLRPNNFPCLPLVSVLFLGRKNFTCLPLVAHLFHISPNFCLCFLLAFQMPSLFVWILLFLHPSPMANGFHDRQQSALDISSFCLGSGIISFSFFWDTFWVCLKTKRTAAWLFHVFST